MRKMQWIVPYANTAYDGEIVPSKKTYHAKRPEAISPGPSCNVRGGDPIADRLRPALLRFF